MTYTIETTRKVWDDKHCTAINIAPDCDGLGLVEIDGGFEFGRIVLDPRMAVMVADAIKACAEEICRSTL